MNKKLFLSFVFGAILFGVLVAPKSFATTKEIYGDVDCNGVVDSTDALLVERYSDKLQNLKDYQLEIADVNYDGYVNKKDSDLILKKSVGLISIFPVELKSFGDVNLDGGINMKDVSCIQSYVSGKRNLTEYQKQFADVNGDGKISLHDATCIQKYVNGWFNYFPVQVQYGDINLDQKLDYQDIKLLYSYINGKVNLTDKQLKIADLNQDGIVTLRDYRLAKKLTGYRE